MSVHVLYESTYGNTHTLAEEVGRGVQEVGGHEVLCLPLFHADPRVLRDAALVVVGVPARRRGDSAAPSGQLPLALAATIREVPAAVFQVRVLRRGAPAAAEAVAAQLQEQGCRLLVPPEDFFLDDGAGPLRAGERSRARSWGGQLVRQLARTGPVPVA